MVGDGVKREDWYFELSELIANCLQLMNSIININTFLNHAQINLEHTFQSSFCAFYVWDIKCLWGKKNRGTQRCSDLLSNFRLTVCVSWMTQELGSSYLNWFIASSLMPCFCALQYCLLCSDLILQHTREKLIPLPHLKSTLGRLSVFLDSPCILMLFTFCL